MRILTLILVVVLFSLDWAALHDILKGDTNPYAEYLMIALSFVVFGGLIIRAVKGSERTI